MKYLGAKYTIFMKNFVLQSGKKAFGLFYYAKALPKSAIDRCDAHCLGRSTRSSGLVLLLVLAALTIATPGSAFAEQQLIKFDLPRQEAATALPQLGSQTKLSVAYKYKIVKDIFTNPVQGYYTLNEALDLLLANTGLTASVNNGRRYILISSVPREPAEPMTTVKKNVVSSIITSLSLSAFAANAQDAGVIQTLEEVVVTAQKRTEDVMTTSVTGDFLSNDTLNQKKVIDLESLQFATPNLSITTAGITSNVNMRGVGLNVTSPDVVPGIAIYRDGLFQPPLMPAEPLFDMASVEVLRGPQGTFTGSSSTGGAIFFGAQKPVMDELSGSASILSGSYDRLGFQGVLNAPVSDTVSARVAINYDHRDSYFDVVGDAATIYPGSPFREPGDKNQRNIRVGLLWEPSDQLSILSTTTINENDTDGFAIIPGSANPLFAGMDYNLQINELGTQYSVNGYRQALEINYEFDSGVMIRSISGYNKVEFKEVSDIDFGSIDSNVLSNNANETVYSQEINILSPEDERLTWVAGVFYFHDVPEIALGVNQSPPPIVDSQVKTTKTGKAIFGHAAYDITDSFEVEVGVRYTESDSEKEGETVLIGLAPVPSVLDQAAEQEDSATTGKLALNWHLDDNHYVYGFYAEGYKAGGVNSPGTPVFEPESVQDYEFGVKSEWMNGQLRSQVNLFFMNYEDMQLSSYIVPGAGAAFGGGNGITNAGGATVKGLEAQLQARLAGFGVDLGLAYTDSELDETLFINPALLPAGGNVPLGPQCSATVTTGCFDYSAATSNLSGVENAYAPELSLSLGVEYTFALSKGAQLTTRVDYAYTGEQWMTIQQNPQDFLASRNLVNASLTLENNDWKLEAFVTNLTDETYISGFNGTGWYLGRPREFAIKASYFF